MHVLVGGGKRKRGGMGGFARRGRLKRSPFLQSRFRSRAVNELKFKDVTVNDATVATGGTIAEDSLLTIAQGSDESERVGRKIIVQSVMMNGSVVLNDPTDQAGSADTVRVIVYVDHQANGATAAVTDILETASFLSFRNLVNSKRFTILMDAWLDLAAPSSGTGALYGRDVKTFKLFKKNLNIDVEYSGTTGVITQMPGNNIGVLTISKSNAAGLASSFRIRYSD